MPRPKFEPGDWGAIVDFYTLQYIRRARAWGPQESKVRAAFLSALAHRHGIDLGQSFHAWIRSLSYNKLKGDEAVEEVIEEQRQPQSVAPTAAEEKPAAPVRTGSILDELDEQEKI